MSVSLERAMKPKQPKKANAPEKRKRAKDRQPLTPWQAPRKPARQQRYSRQQLKDIALSEADGFPTTLSDLSIRWPLIDPRRLIEHCQSVELSRKQTLKLALKYSSQVQSRLGRFHGWLEVAALMPRLRIPIPAIFSTREKEKR